MCKILIVGWELSCFLLVSLGTNKVESQYAIYSFVLFFISRLIYISFSPYFLYFITDHFFSEYVDTFSYCIFFLFLLELLFTFFSFSTFFVEMLSVIARPVNVRRHGENLWSAI